MNYLDSKRIGVFNNYMKSKNYLFNFLLIFFSIFHINLTNAVESKNLAQLSCDGTFTCPDCSHNDLNISPKMFISEKKLDGELLHYSVNFSGLPEFFSFKIIESTIDAPLMEFGQRTSPDYEVFDYGNLDTYNGELLVLNGFRKPDDSIKVNYMFRGKCKKGERLF